MSITLEINNPNTFEKELIEFVQQQKQELEEVTIEALNNFLNSFKKRNKIEFQKKDPRKHSHIIKREYNEEDVDEVALLHIEDSGKYVHDRRREARK